MHATLLTLLLAHAPARATTEAHLTPETVAPGDPATLTITTDTGAAPTIGSIPGVRVAGTGRSTQVQIINGAVSQQTTYTYRLVPGSPGSYELGPYTVGPDQTPSLTLHVDPSAPSSRSPTWSAPSARGRSAQPTPPTVGPDAERAFARMWLEDTDPVVGQAVPLTVSAYLRSDVGGTLEAAPSIDAPDFIIEGLDEEPSRTESEVDGVPYTRFTWTASLTPVRAGEYELSTSIPATLQWIEQTARPRRRSLIDELLANDPFFRGSGLPSVLQQFGSLGMGSAEPQMRSAHVDLSARRSLTVALPPAEGRPADYTGAVGDFTLALQGVPQEVSVGEPIELVWTVSGRGNFDALDAPGVADGDTWDSYPIERAFEPSNRSRTKGALTLTQLVVPREPGDLALPPLSFSWFDPVAGTYQSSTVEIPRVRVTGAGTATPPPSASSSAAGVDAGSSGRDVRRGRLLPTAARGGVLWVAGSLWALLAIVWLFGDRIRSTLGSLLILARGHGHTAGLRRRLRRAIAQRDANAVIEAGLALVEAGVVDTDADATRAFVAEAERVLYGNRTPDPTLLTEHATAMLGGRASSNTDHKEAA